MEKLANNSTSDMKKFISLELLILLLLLLFTTITSAQETPYGNGKKYILGGIEVKGLQSYNEQTVITFTGLREGQPITVPGDQISGVIKKLWDLELFSDIKFYISNIEGETVYLELDIVERPTLSKVTIYGIKKKKIDDIIKETDLKKGKKVTESFISNTRNYIQNKYKKDGYLNAKVTIATAIDTSDTNAESMVVNIKTGDKVKIKNITIDGNKMLSDKQLRKSLKNTNKNTGAPFVF